MDKEKGGENYFLRLIFCCLLFCFCLFASNVLYSQTLKQKLKLKLESVQFVQFDDQSGDATVSQYIVNGKPLKLMEVYFAHIEKLKPTMEAKLNKLHNCINETPLFYKKKLVGHSYMCTQGAKNILIYDYGEKYYEIAADSENTINEFTRNVTPISCHLHGSECISMYY